MFSSIFFRRFFATPGRNGEIAFFMCAFPLPFICKWTNEKCPHWLHSFFSAGNEMHLILGLASSEIAPRSNGRPTAEYRGAQSDCCSAIAFPRTKNASASQGMGKAEREVKKIEITEGVTASIDAHFHNHFQILHINRFLFRNRMRMHLQFPLPRLKLKRTALYTPTTQNRMRHRSPDIERIEAIGICYTASNAFDEATQTGSRQRQQFKEQRFLISHRRHKVNYFVCFGNK